MKISITPTQEVVTVVVFGQPGTGSPKLGGVVNVAPFTDLVELRARNHDITEVTGWENNSNLQVLLIADNKLTGPIPDLSNLTSIKYFWVMGNELTGSFPDLNGLTDLRLINVGNNNLTGTFPADLQSLGITKMSRFNAYGNSFTGSIPDFAGQTVLQYCLVDNNNLTDFTGTITPTMHRFIANNNNLTETAVDNILQALVDANGTSLQPKVLQLSGTGNSTPSAAGIANKNTLISRGWTVSTN